MTRVLFLAALALTGCAANTCPKAHEVGLECHANTWRVAGVVNLAHVEGRSRVPIYRGGQPTSGEAWGELALTFGVTNVLKLNEAEEGSDAGAEFYGIRVHHVPLPPSTQRWLSVFERPDNATMRQLVAVVEQMRRGGVWYVHCQNGHDRTGLAIMLVRVLLDSWTPAEAYEEARQWGYHHQIPGLDWARHYYVKGQ